MTYRPHRWLVDALASMFPLDYQTGGIVDSPRLVRYRETSNRPHSLRVPVITPVNHLAHPFEDQSRVEFEVRELQRYTINVSQEMLFDISRRDTPLPDDIVDMSLIAFLGEPRASWVRSLPDLEVSVDRDIRTYSYHLCFSSYSLEFVEVMQGGPRAREIVEGHRMPLQLQAMDIETLQAAFFGSTERADSYTGLPLPSQPSVHVQQPEVPASSERRLKLNHKLRGKSDVTHSHDQGDQNSVHQRIARRRARAKRTPRR